MYTKNLNFVGLSWRAWPTEQKKNLNGTTTRKRENSDPRDVLYLRILAALRAYETTRGRERESKERKGERGRREQRETIRVREPARCAAYWGDRHRQADSNAPHRRVVSSPFLSLAPFTAATTQPFLLFLSLSLSRPIPFLSFSSFSSLYTCICIAVVCFHSRRRICPLQLHSWNKMLPKYASFFSSRLQLEHPVEKVN